MRTCQLFNGTFKSMVLVKFNMMTIKDWWFNFMMDWYRLQCWLRKRPEWGKNTSVIIESGTEIELLSWSSESYSCSSSISGKDNLPKYQCGSQNSDLVKFKWVRWNWILVSKTTWFLVEIDRVRDIWIDQRLIRASFLIPMNVDQLTQLTSNLSIDWVEDFWNCCEVSCKISILFSRSDFSSNGYSKKRV